MGGPGQEDATERPGQWKWPVRFQVWDELERGDAAEPRPVLHRIPNHKGAAQAAQRLASLPEFAAAKCVKGEGIAHCHETRCQRRNNTLPP